MECDRSRPIWSRTESATSLYETTQPATRFLFFRKSHTPQEIAFSAGKKQAGELQDGKAKLVVEAVSDDLRGSTGVGTSDVEVNTRPLTIAADGAQHYVNQGGMRTGYFHLAGSWTESGVRVGKYTFRS